jgi:hypothetical protein
VIDAYYYNSQAEDASGDVNVIKYKRGHRFVLLVASDGNVYALDPYRFDAPVLLEEYMEDVVADTFFLGDAYAINYNAGLHEIYLEDPDIDDLEMVPSEELLYDINTAVSGDVIENDEEETDSDQETTTGSIADTVMSGDVIEEGEGE